MTSTHDADFYLEKTLSENPSDIAHFLKYLYYPYIRFDGKYWYSFENHHWIITEEDNSPLIQIIQNDLAKRYTKLAITYNERVMQKNRILSNQTQNPINDDVLINKEYLPLIISDLTNKSRLCSQVILNLGEPTYYQKINDSAKRLFTTKHFDLTLDQAPNLIGFNNVVYNLTTNTIDVPNHAHRVMLSTEYNYISETLYQKDVKLFWKKLNLYEVLPSIASLLYGDRRQPLIWINGLNEESFYAISQLLHWSLGDYLGHLSFSTLRKHKIPSPQNYTHSELINNCKKRIVIVEQCPDDQPSVFPPMVDLLLGSSNLNLRKPREISVDHIPQFGIIVLSRKTDCIPMEGALIFNSETVENIQSKEEWKMDFMKILLEFNKEAKS